MLTIWSNESINIDDWSDYLEEFYPEAENDYEKYSLVCDLNNSYLDDERINLNVQLEDEIIVIGSLGLWNGRVSGYKIIESGNIADCLYSDECDYCTWYCDRYNLRFHGYHHDGCNSYLYRTWKRGLSSEQKDNFLDKLYRGTASRNDVTRCTSSLRPHIASVYGW